MASESMGGIPVHVGTLLTDVPDRRPGRRRIRRSPLIDPGIDWATPGFVPRWLGMESSDCAVALEPSLFHGRGAEELTRFLAGTAGREETALVVTTVGDVADDGPRSVLGTHDASISLPGLRGIIYGRRLPAGSRPVLASDVSSADRDLGLRLLDRPAEAPWWSLSLSGLTLEPGAGGPPEHHGPEGELRPILVDGLGDPVVAAWIAPGQRWYIVPDVTDWNALISTRALFDWWRASDWPAIRSALLGEAALGAPDGLGGPPAASDAMADVESAGETLGRRRWWRAGRGR